MSQAPDNTTQDVLVEHDGDVAIVTLSYPQRRNAFSLKIRQALYDTLYRLMHHDATCRAIVLTGHGQVFCAGGDISEMKERTVLEYRERNLLPLNIFRLMVEGPKAVVAAVASACPKGAPCKPSSPAVAAAAPNVPTVPVLCQCW